MGGLFSGVGLISGIDFASIVDQLISIEARPRDLLLRRIANLDAQNGAYSDISARLLGLIGRLSTLTKQGSFRGISANSSNSDVLSVSASDLAHPGTYRFLVKSLASAHQFVSSGFRSADAPLSPGTLTIESGRARLNLKTSLDELNGYAGVQRGRFEIVDGDGEKATINIAQFDTLSEVVEAINESGTQISAAVQNDALVLRDATGKQFRIRELDGGHVAADLGFKLGNQSGTDEIQGDRLMMLSFDTPLARLHDGNGIRRGVAGADFIISSTGNAFETINVDLSGLLTDDTRLERLNGGFGVDLGVIRVTNRAGKETEIDLTGLKTIREVRDALDNSDAGISVTLTGQRLIISDVTGEKKGTLAIADVSGNAAHDLGIEHSTTGEKFDGRQVLKIDTLRDVVAAINYAAGNDKGTIRASLSDDGGRLIIEAVGGESFRIAAGKSQALFDLGFAEGTFGPGGESEQAVGRRILGGIDSVLLDTLNGGQGFAVVDEDGVGAVVRITDGKGKSADIDLSKAETLGDVIDLINAADLAIDVGYDVKGTGLRIVSEEGVSGPLKIEDVKLNFAASLGIAGQGVEIQSDNLQKQYVSETTLLDDLNAGLGISRGKFRITDSSGNFETIDLTDSSITTVGDVIAEINRAGLRVRASINETGDGIVIADDNGVRSRLKIEDLEGGRAAHDLHLAGDSDVGKIDGSFELKIELEGGETAQELVDLVNERSTLARANIFSDGRDVNPYRLTISSRATGTVGEMILDGGELGLDFTMLTRAQDAVVVIGDDPQNGGIRVRSSSNTITDVIPGLTLNLNSASDDVVAVTVDQSMQTALSALEGLVADYNNVMDRIDELTSYNPDTERAGILLGDSATAAIERRLTGMVTGRIPGARGKFTRLSDMGIRIGEGARLKFDETKFTDAFAEDPEAVIRFFTDLETGAANVLQEALEQITDSGGLLDGRKDSLEKRKDLLNDRITTLNDLLTRKRGRLMRQFFAMEQTLSMLQAQQGALASLQALAQNASLRN